jgi:dienelactone hydrolase
MEVMGNLEEGTRRLMAARTALANDPRVDAEKLAAIGYCMGGALALHMARAGADLDVVASFHGNLATQSKMQTGAFKGRILVAHGGSDPFVPAEQLAAFEKEMQAAGARYEVVVYPNAKHGFTNPDATLAGETHGLPLAYDAEADVESWKRLEQLLAETWGE